ncbi:hypothetical protein ABZ619_38645 [Streptomyces sp. NPDC007851]|uniref:hypothetical protein n=1 Tax=Streptomyces sp. NPDC007851 TaxID=3155008 RepID=UPI0033FE7805
MNTDVSPLDHHPDQRRQYCLLCGDLSTDPTRCPGWLAHRTQVTYHAEAWENSAWTGIVSSHDLLTDTVVQYGHKRRRFPDAVMRLMAKITVYVPVAEPADPAEQMRQLLDGAADTTALLSRSWGQERDRALRAEARARELEEELEAAHEARLHEPVLRHCLYPGCMREFDMKASLTGRTPARPTWSGEGWVQVRAVDGNMCPDHVDIVGSTTAGPGPHLPHWQYGEDGAPNTLRCACGWSSTARWRGFGTEAWKDHLLTVAEKARVTP